MSIAKDMIGNLRCVVTLVFAVSYIVSVFARFPWLTNVNLVLMVVVLALSLFSARGTSRVIGAAMIAISMVVLLCMQAPLDVWVKALQKNADLVVMFIMIPLLSIPVQHGGYSDSLRSLFLGHLKSEGGYYALVSGMAAVLGSLISIAAVPLTYEVARESPHSRNGRLMGSALSRGFITCMIWAPTSATIALVASLTPIDWAGFIPCAVGFVLAVEVIGTIMAALSEKRHSACAPLATQARSEDATAVTGAVKPDGRKLLQLGLFAVALIVCIAIAAQVFRLSVILVVAMASLVWPVLWMLVIGRASRFAQAFKEEYYAKKLPKADRQIVLFVGAGMFAQSIGFSGAGDVLAQGLLGITGQSALLLTLGIMALVLATSAFGVHPIVAVAVIGGAVDPSLCGISANYLALTLSVSWALGNAICPASANVIAVSELVHHSPLDVSLKWNTAFVLLAVAAFLVFASAARMVGWL